MSEDMDVIEYQPQPRHLTLGALPVQGPAEIITRATEVATALSQIVEKQKLFTNISGRKFVRVEGWNTLGAMLGILPREDANRTHRIEVDGDPGYEAFVDLINPNTGAVIGGASAICTRGERNWKTRDDYAIRSMAVTRATGKAFRLGFSWIMALAGYEPTPAEEMPEDGKESKSTTKGKAPNGNGDTATVEPLPPEQWNTIEPPVDFTDLWKRNLHLLIGFDNKNHAINAVVGKNTGTYPGKKLGDDVSVEEAWAAMLDHQRSKAADPADG